ncbi:alpha/beta fold hydrolase [Rhodococcoides corynebacterioides]|uniref:Alpha/beta hydrolase n=1 Tax=Rhodococcoides corynebacterioides TaxID=53972 RepID=A0ABS7P650_9NOCA|nr:alpha/beta fold hydrolase [Rhodococcus corynebacterioides]MBY6367496.1 alpha/beta hydrolase [Rhodococcus corynebacterioides]MBY6407188.1 alpha/beta hydrolase [Rhodococcus corynebacterioides]
MTSNPASSPHRPASRDVVLVPGHWLGAWAWDEVVAALTDLGTRAWPITLPGLDPDDDLRASRTLDDQAAAIEECLVRAGEGRAAVLVAHSGANAPACLVLDRHPELIHRMVWVDSGPVTSGSAADPAADGDRPLPPFDVLGQQAGLEGLSEETLARFRADAVDHPATTLRQAVHLTNDARRRTPTTMVCCSIRSERMMELARAGHPMFAEVAHLENLDLVDLPTGHWPLWSRPADLARILHDVATAD